MSMTLHHHHGQEPLETDRLLSVAAKALLGYFVWWDMLHRASSGGEPLLNVKHDHLLDCGAVDIGELTGCDNAVLKCICQVADLATWKAEAEAAGTLSVYELVRRGAKIQEELDHAATFQPLRTTSSSSATKGPITGASTTNGPMTRQMTSAFRNAAAVYLHVLVSGPNPRLAEIQKAVGETRLQLIQLAEAEMLGYAAWPLCVAACLAPREDQQAFESLVARASGEIRFQSVSQALKVARKCWAMRAEGRADVYWRTVIHGLDVPILLA